MSDLLRRSLAPLTEEAWEIIDSTAARVLKSHLTARSFVDFDGPHGWNFAAVNLGRLEISQKNSDSEPPWGKRLVQPLIETRVSLQLDQMEIDGIARGAKDINLDSLEDAAHRAALFEESAIYNGFEAGGIEGILSQNIHQPINLPDKAQEFPKVVALAVRKMALVGIRGPFTLILGNDAWVDLMQSGSGGYPPQKIVRDLIGGEIHMSPIFEGGLLVSAAGDYFELAIGQDFSIGYAGHDQHTLDLYITESFTFRVLEPKAAVRFLQPV